MSSVFEQPQTTKKRDGRQPGRALRYAKGFARGLLHHPTGHYHVQLPEYLQQTQAWATLKPGPRALYIELKRRFNGNNNGQIILSYRDAATALNAHRNTIGAWFRELEERGFITKTQGAYLGPEGVGRAALWAVQELPLANGKSAPKAFLKWRELDAEKGRRHD